MNSLTIQTSTGHCSIYLDNSLQKLKNHLKANKVLVVTDQTVSKLYKSYLEGFNTVEIGKGEKIKNLNSIDNIYDRFLQLELERSSLVIGMGGGIVCDMTGFAASTYLRGMKFGFIPTTLLAQVDAAIGGKNGVNYKGYKNLIGVFNQPEFVLCDPSFMNTLPKKELLCGIAEIVKHSLIKKSSLFNYLENHWNNFLSGEKEAIKKGVEESILIKSDVVKKDDIEAGERRKLNFGHTLGHALEKTIGLSHGEAISIGMIFASRLSVAKGLISASKIKRIEILLGNLGLPIRIPSKNLPLIDAIRKDKKRQGDYVHFVLLKDIGEAVISKITLRELEDYINDLCHSG